MNLEETVKFILEQQAKLTATVGQLAVTVDRLSAKVERNADGIASLLAIAEIHDRELKETDERLNTLINTVERYVSEGRSG